MGGYATKQRAVRETQIRPFYNTQEAKTFQRELNEVSYVEDYQYVCFELVFETSIFLDFVSQHELQRFRLILPSGFFSPDNMTKYLANHQKYQRNQCVVMCFV